MRQELKIGLGAAAALAAIWMATSDGGAKLRLKIGATAQTSPAAAGGRAHTEFPEFYIHQTPCDWEPGGRLHKYPHRVGHFIRTVMEGNSDPMSGSARDESWYWTPPSEED